MKCLPVLLLVIAAIPIGAASSPPLPAARADCMAGVVSAYARADALPPTPGRAALLEQIQRAQIARHEDDEEGCRDELRVATDVLDRIDASKARVTPGVPAPPGHAPRTPI